MTPNTSCQTSATACCIGSVNVTPAGFAPAAARAGAAAGRANDARAARRSVAKSIDDTTTTGPRSERRTRSSASGPRAGLMPHSTIRASSDAVAGAGAAAVAAGGRARSRGGGSFAARRVRGGQRLRRDAAHHEFFDAREHAAFGVVDVDVERDRLVVGLRCDARMTPGRVGERADRDAAIGERHVEIGAVLVVAAGRQTDRGCKIEQRRVRRHESRNPPDTTDRAPAWRSLRRGREPPRGRRSSAGRRRDAHFGATRHPTDRRRNRLVDARTQRREIRRRRLAGRRRRRDRRMRVFIPTVWEAPSGTLSMSTSQRPPSSGRAVTRADAPRRRRGRTAR